MFATARYLLLNPRYRDPMALATATEVTDDQGLYPIHQPHLIQPAHWALRLIDLDQRPDIRQWSREWVAQVEARQLPRDLFCGWLASELSPKLLAAQLGLQLRQVRPDGQPMLLCYLDVQVLDQLIHIVTPDQLYELMGAITRWQILDVNHRPLIIERPKPQGLARMLDAAQWDAIAEIEELGSIRAAWQQVAGERPLPDDHYRRLTTWLHIAQRHGIEALTDRCAFVLLGVTHGWRFDRTPWFAALLERQRVSRLPLIELFKRTDRTDWATLEQAPVKEAVDDV